MALLIDLCFLAYAFYTINHRECIFKLTVFNYMLRMINHTWPFSLQIATIAGVSLYTYDVYFLILLIILIIELFQDHFVIEVDKANIAYLLFAFMVLVSWVLGFIKFGFISDWVGDTRKFFGFVIPVLYFMSHPVEFNSSNFRFLTFVMRAVLLYCFICWFSALVLGVYLTSNGSLRCMGSDYAMILGIYTIYLFYRDLVFSERGVIKLETLLFILAIIILQHNSVYMVLATGIVVIVLFRYGKVFLQNPKWIFQVVIIAGLLIAFSFTSIGQGLLEPLTETFEKFQQAFLTAEGSEEGTIGTRYIIWRELIATLTSPADWLVGKRMGTGYHVSYLGGTWEVSPHSGYIEGLMRVGLIGMFGLILQVISNIVFHLRRGEILFAAILAGLLVYWIPYTYSNETGFLLGMSIAVINNMVSLPNYSEGETEE